MPSNGHDMHRMTGEQQHCSNLWRDVSTDSQSYTSTS